MSQQRAAVADGRDPAVEEVAAEEDLFLRGIRSNDGIIKDDVHTVLDLINTYL